MVPYIYFKKIKIFGSLPYISPKMVSQNLNWSLPYIAPKMVSKIELQFKRAW